MFLFKKSTPTYLFERICNLVSRWLGKTYGKETITCKYFICHFHTHVSSYIYELYIVVRVVKSNKQAILFQQTKNISRSAGRDILLLLYITILASWDSQSEASIQVKWSLRTNQRPVLHNSHFSSPGNTHLTREA